MSESKVTIMNALKFLLPHIILAFLGLFVGLIFGLFNVGSGTAETFTRWLKGTHSAAIPTGQAIIHYVTLMLSDPHTLLPMGSSGSALALLFLPVLLMIRLTAFLLGPLFIIAFATLAMGGLGLFLSSLVTLPSFKDWNSLHWLRVGLLVGGLSPAIPLGTQFGLLGFGFLFFFGGLVGLLIGAIATVVSLYHANRADSAA